MDRVRKLHFTWLGFIGLWLLAFAAISFDIYSTPEPVVNSNTGEIEISHVARNVADFFIFLYLGGGFVLGKLNDKYIAQFEGAKYLREDSADVSVFTVVPANRHLPFWLFGLSGAVLMFTVPNMLAGSAAGAFFTLVTVITLFMVGLQPKFWLPLPNYRFEASPVSVKTAEEEAAVQNITGLFIDNSIENRKPVEKQDEIAYAPMQNNAPRNATADEVMASQSVSAMSHMIISALLAAGNAIASISNHYAKQMRARSFVIEAITPEKNIVLAKGLDANTAQKLMNDIGRATAISDRAAAA